jgi:hypothetical protein
MRHEEQLQRVGTFGFTERQTRFLLLVLRHSGVCLARQYCTYAGIVRGQKTQDFFGRLVSRGLATPYPCGHSRARVYHLHHKALYRAIGEPETRLRRPATLGRAVERLMVLDYLVAHPQTTWLATEGEKVEHFVSAGLHLDELPSITFTGKESSTKRFFTERLPIGLPDPESGYVFLWLAMQEVPVDFRSYLQRHADLLRRLRNWRIQLLVPRHLARHVPRYEQAFREELTQPLRPDVAGEVRWYFEQLRQGAPNRGSRFQAARRDFGGPRFRALYRTWQVRGDPAVFSASSRVPADAIADGAGRLVCEVPTRQYLHLAPLVGTA